MLGCDVLSVVILIDSGVVGIRIFFAGMLAFGHDGCRGTSGHIGLSMALVNFSCTSVARSYRFHESVSVAYFRVMDRPPFMIVLIVELLITLLAILAGAYNVS